MANEAKSKFVERFGTLVDTMDRSSAKGPYITFKMTGTKKDGETFDIYGACFNADIIAQMKAAVGQQIWTKGPLDTFGEGENKKTSYKVIYFKVSEPKADAEAPAENNNDVPA